MRLVIYLYMKISECVLAAEFWLDAAIFFRDKLRLKSEASWHDYDQFEVWLEVLFKPNQKVVLRHFMSKTNHSQMLTMDMPNLMNQWMNK